MKGGEASQEFVLSRHLGVRLGITPRLDQLVDSDRIRLCSFMVPMLVFEAYCGRLSTLIAERAASSALQEYCTDRPATFLHPAPYHVTSITPGPSERQRQRLPRSLGSRDSIRRGRSLLLSFQLTTQRLIIVGTSSHAVLPRIADCVTRFRRQALTKQKSYHHGATPGESSLKPATAEACTSLGSSRGSESLFLTRLCLIISGSRTSVLSCLATQCRGLVTPSGTMGADCSETWNAPEASKPVSSSLGHVELPDAHEAPQVAAAAMAVPETTQVAHDASTPEPQVDAPLPAGVANQAASDPGLPEPQLCAAPVHVQPLRARRLLKRYFVSFSSLVISVLYSAVHL
ncbi:uncharacterized protein LOC119181453 isoform X3 [Rhipicephalus microplus]|uniref:uncharacterized protein LOC119181453 isoform X3 n=1 Tax=Rhipicephalus microplus TaxID=6941 RepID=UPI003F6B5258